MSKKSNADLIREKIKDAETQNVDLTQSSNRQAIVDNIITENPHLGNKKLSLQAHFSEIIKKNAKSKGADPAKFVKQHITKNYDPSIDTALDAKPVAPAIYNPTIDPNAPVKPNENQPLNPYKIQEKQVEALCDSIFEFVKSFDSNIESLDKSEKEAIGGLWTPIIQDHVNSKKTLMVMAVGSTVGTFARKIKKGRNITKAQRIQQRQKEKNEDQAAVKKATQNTAQYRNPEQGELPPEDRGIMEHG